jgi:hypothetical protein
MHAPGLPVESIMFLHHLGGYAGPIHVSSDASCPAQCVRLKDRRLHVWRRGNFPDLLNGPNYILARPALAKVLQTCCASSVEFAPAQVINVQTGRQLAKYYEVLPHDEVTPRTIGNVDSSGVRAWHYRKSYLYVTKRVALELQRRRFRALQYEPGFFGFCGGSAAGMREVACVMQQEIADG